MKLNLEDNVIVEWTPKDGNLGVPLNLLTGNNTCIQLCLKSQAYHSTLLILEGSKIGHMSMPSNVNQGN